MNYKEAINFLDPETTRSALFGMEKEEAIPVIEEACRIACQAMREHTQWNPVEKVLPSGRGKLVLELDVTYVGVTTAALYLPNYQKFFDHRGNDITNLVEAWKYKEEPWKKEK